MKVMFSKGFLEEGRLVKVVLNKLGKDGRIGWWEEYEVFRKKYELYNQHGSVCTW